MLTTSALEQVVEGRRGGSMLGGPLHREVLAVRRDAHAERERDARDAAVFERQI
jgi:hypothetical protein